MSEDCDEDIEYYAPVGLPTGNISFGAPRHFYPYYLPTEVAVHNTPDDCWLSYLGHVYDVTHLCTLWRHSVEIQPILANAGKDTSHWFDHDQGGDIRYAVDQVSGVEVPYCPYGPIPDVSANCCSIPSTNRCPWWLDERYKIGLLTKSPRTCRVINGLTGDSAVISVCDEDTINRIAERYGNNLNAEGDSDADGSYQWRFEGKNLDMKKTLTENGIRDDQDRFVACGLPDDFYVPTLICYFEDNFAGES